MVVIVITTKECTHHGSVADGLEGHREERLEVLEELEEDDGEEVGPQEGLHQTLAGGGGKGGYPRNPAEAAPEAAPKAPEADAAGRVGW